MDNRPVGLNISDDNVCHRFPFFRHVADSNCAGLAIVVPATALLDTDELTKKGFNSRPPARLQQINGFHESVILRVKIPIKNVAIGYVKMINQCN